jgi:peptide/nickel transport system substrate-binding protein
MMSCQSGDRTEADMQATMSRRRLLELGAAAAAGATLLGDPALAAVGSRTARAASGGTLRWATSGGSAKDTLDPALTFNIFTFAVNNAIYDSLVRQDSNLALHPRLATDWTATKDAKTWTFKLRPNVTFHDGRKLTATDVVYSVERILVKSLGAAGFGSLSALLAAGGTTAVDPTTVRFALTSANAFFPNILASSSFAIVPDGTTDFSKGIGTGPFTLKSFQPLANAELVRNPNHWQAPLLDGIQLVSVTEDATRLQGVLSGSQDFVDNVTGASINQLKGNAVPLLIKDGGFVNLAAMRDKKPFDNPLVTQAMKYAMDRKKVAAILAPNAQILLADVPLPSRDTFYPKGLTPKPYDPEKAKSLLKQAGYADGLKLDLYAYEGDKLSAALAYKSSAKAAGLTINIKQWPHATYWDQVWLKKPFVGDSWGRLHISDMLAQTFASKAPYNESHFYDKDVDKLIVAARSTTNEATQRKHYQDILLKISKTSSDLIPCCEPQAYGAKSNLKGVWLTSGVGVYFDQAHFS